MLELENINVHLGDFALKDVNLFVEKGEYYVILGLSGAGKSIMLEAIAGMHQTDAGRIILDKNDITNKKIQHRDVGYVFQDHAVFPHMKVHQNIAYSIKNKFPKDELKRKVEEIAEKVNVSHLLHRDPKTLSGGESQRVALARTLVRDPKILMLDEPFASLDVQLRDDLRALLRNLNREGQTIIHVTHDYEEAISLAQKLAIFQNGKLIQQGTPKEVFANPASQFVARFRGIRNFFTSELKELDVAVTDTNAEVKILPQEEISKGYVMLKSQDIILSKEEDGTSMANHYKGIVTDIVPSFKGNEVVVEADLKLTAFITHQSLKNLELKLGDEVWAAFKASAVNFIKSENPI